MLDGEVLGVDEDAKPRAFQDTMSAFGRDDALGAGDGLLVRFFDVLHLDGVDLIDEPLDDAAPAPRRARRATWPSRAFARPTRSRRRPRSTPRSAARATRA